MGEGHAQYAVLIVDEIKVSSQVLRTQEKAMAADDSSLLTKCVDLARRDTFVNERHCRKTK